MVLATSLMPAFGAWLKSTRLTEFSVWIGDTRLSAFLNQNNWITPTLQSIHILAVALTFSAALMICLRIAGLSGRSRSLPEIQARYAPWIWGGLLTLLATGLVLTLAEPSRQLLNPYFWTKMMLVVFVAAVTLWFQQSVRHDAAVWRPGIAVGGLPRAAALAMVAVWAAIMVCGRWIAYGV